jgi:hypothetical protein
LFSSGMASRMSRRHSPLVCVSTTSRRLAPSLHNRTTRKRPRIQ